MSKRYDAALAAYEAAGLAVNGGRGRPDYASFLVGPLSRAASSATPGAYADDVALGRTLIRSAMDRRGVDSITADTLIAQLEDAWVTLRETPVPRGR